MKFDPKDSHITRNIRALEWLKTEMLEHVSSLFKAIYHGSHQKMVDSLSSLLIAVYLLGSRLGIKYHEIDEAMLSRIREKKAIDGDQEQWYDDLSNLEQYVNKR